MFTSGCSAVRVDSRPAGRPPKQTTGGRRLRWSPHHLYIHTTTTRGRKKMRQKEILVQQQSTRVRTHNQGGLAIDGGRCSETKRERRHRRHHAYFRVLLPRAIEGREDNIEETNYQLEDFIQQDESFWEAIFDQ
ncbi:hypothetical protein PROFUN_08600 [Planoprotostelium fungivorum]|uniref:Uncharacterized protein n=1 Tax=Planoprotostelium fungivorum TaxID=1890364 RepID=A0A2P6NJ61_9EUKA|nr:hypothetical protein PROFUN_08600 [Planoprotostelium fungivorum]